MINKYYKEAFTLVELLTVVVIIGMIASVALVTLRDTGEVQAKQYTKQVIQSVKDGIANKDGEYFTGFMNDFGTMPPSIPFLLNETDSYKFVDNKPLERLKIKEFHDYNRTKGRVIAIPFMDNTISVDDYNDTDLNGVDLSKFQPSTLYIGHHGGYVGEVADSDKNKSIKDGWNSILNAVIDLNGSNDNDNSFLTIQSGGSDKTIAPTTDDKYIKPEFDEYSDDDSLKGFFADDLNITYRKESFIPKGLVTDVNSSRSVIIYSSMLYYVEGSSGEDCNDFNTTHADCDGTHRKYKPYDYSSTAANINSDNILNWQIGVIKYQITEDSIFVNDLNNTNYTVSGSYIDFDENFYISAGEKEVVIIDDDTVTSSFSKTFLPNRKIDITYPHP